jgi:DNA anti-recombination protein RmuC
MGAAFDLTEAGVERNFVEDMGAKLAPGKAAVIAEIDEYWQVPLDTRMEALGGNVLRQTRTQIEDAYAERAAEAAQRELAALEAEKLAQVTTAQTEKARKQAEKLQAKIDAAQRKAREKEAELAAKARAVRDEGNKKIAMLEAQKATAVSESKAVLDKRLADLRGEYDDRIMRLQEAVNRRKAAHATSAA